MITIGRLPNSRLALVVAALTLSSCGRPRPLPPPAPSQTFSMSEMQEWGRTPIDLSCSRPWLAFPTAGLRQVPLEFAEIHYVIPTEVLWEGKRALGRRDLYCYRLKSTDTRNPWDWSVWSIVLPLKHFFLSCPDRANPILAWQDQSDVLALVLTGPREVSDALKDISTTARLDPPGAVRVPFGQQFGLLTFNGGHDNPQMTPTAIAHFDNGDWEVTVVGGYPAKAFTLRGHPGHWRKVKPSS